HGIRKLCHVWSRQANDGGRRRSSGGPAVSGLLGRQFGRFLGASSQVFAQKESELQTGPRSRLARLEAAERQSGTRSGALLAVASGVAIVANYIFLLAAGRLLGSDRYGSLAALLGLLAVVLIPAQALQMAVSREVSRRIASGDSASAYAFARRTLRLALIATGPLVVLALVLALPLSNLLNIDSTGVVVLAEAGLVTAFIAPVAMGVLQGTQRFHALAALYVVPFLLRLGVFAIAAAAGYRLGAAVLATTASTLVGTALALFYWATGVGLVSTSFGSGFREGGTVLAPFALEIGLFSVANILVGYHLSRGESRYAWIVAAGVLVQVAVLALIPSSLAGVVWS